MFARIRNSYGFTQHDGHLAGLFRSSFTRRPYFEKGAIPPRRHLSRGIAPTKRVQGQIQSNRPPRQRSTWQPRAGLRLSREKEAQPLSALSRAAAGNKKAPTDALRLVGAISLSAVLGGPHPHQRCTNHRGIEHRVKLSREMSANDPKRSLSTTSGRASRP